MIGECQVTKLHASVLVPLVLTLIVEAAWARLLAAQKP
jgi:hypothetical protein